MVEHEGDFVALTETTVFLRHFKDLPDHRQPGKILYPLDEVLLLCLLAVLAGAETFTDIARFGEKKSDLLRSFRPFANGTPSHDHLGDIFATLDSQAFQRCFVSRVAALTGAPADVIAIDGRTSRRSGSRKGSNEPLHMVSAFAARQRLVLGQVAVSEKSNEIVAIPALLDMMAIEGAVVTIDAMGAQRNIAARIIARKADYIIALKGNQGTLHDDVKLFTAEQQANGCKDTVISRFETLDGEHGRMETRRYTGIHDLECLRERHDWPGLKGIVIVESQREIDGATTRQTAPLRHLPDRRGQRPRTDDPQPVVHREQPALGDGHGLVRRRLPRANPERTRKLHHNQAHGQQSHPKSPGKGLAAPPPNDRSMGR